MRWLLRIAILVPILLVAIAIAGLGWFRLATHIREDRYPERAVGPQALYARANDVTVHYSTWGPADGPPLLLIHGTLSWSQTWRDIAEPLGERGFRVIAIDMPPFGYSQKPSNQNYGRAATAKRILAFADSIGLQTFAIGVHSYGGGGALEAAFSAPDRIDRLVLLDVALGLDSKTASGPPLGRLLEIPFLRTVFSSATFANPLMVGPGLRAFVHDDAIVTPERVELYARPLNVKRSAESIGNWIVNGLYGDEGKSRAARLDNYRAFDKPVLIIWGREDKTTPLEQGQRIAGLLPDARLEVLDGVDHIPQMEAPERVVELIGDFLARRTPASGGTPQAGLDMAGGAVSYTGMNLRLGLD